MKIQFTAPHTDVFGMTYLPGWVADWSEPDAKAAIAAGVAVLAPANALSRKTTDTSFECAQQPLDGDFTKTGEQITLKELTRGKNPR